MREFSLKINVENRFFSNGCKMTIFLQNFKKKTFFGLCEAWTSIKWSFSSFYFYFFRRKTNDESRYLSVLRFLILHFTEPNQHWITVCKLISILNFTFSVAKPNVESRKAADISKKTFTFSYKTKTPKKAAVKFYFFSGPEKAPKIHRFGPNLVFGVHTRPENRVSARD